MWSDLPAGRIIPLKFSCVLVGFASRSAVCPGCHGNRERLRQLLKKLNWQFLANPLVEVRWTRDPDFSRLSGLRQCLGLGCGQPSFCLSLWRADESFQSHVKKLPHGVFFPERGFCRWHRFFLALVAWPISEHKDLL